MPRTTPATTTTGHALLGLLAIRSWTAYELTQQMRRALRWAWPRSEANLYNEMKRLVPPGLAEAFDEDTGGRSRTRYQITDQGREAVREWLASDVSSAPQVQAEALLRVFVADHGTLDDLRNTIAGTRRQMQGFVGEAIGIIDEYGSDEPPFPGRAHLNVLFIHFFAGFVEHVLEWCDDAEAELETWPGTTAGVGMTPGTRRMLEDAGTRYRRLADRGSTEGSGR
jgi:PadR family transcriptional regulator, regulatory protein AphA